MAEVDTTSELDIFIFKHDNLGDIYNSEPGGTIFSYVLVQGSELSTSKTRFSSGPPEDIQYQCIY